MSWFLNKQLIAPKGALGTYLISPFGNLILQNSVEVIKLTKTGGDSKIWFS